MNNNLISTLLAADHHAALCPAWCALPADHAATTEPDTDGTRYVLHSGPVLADAGGRSLVLEQTDVIEPDGTVEHEAVAVVLDGDALRSFEVDQARHLAAALALATELATGGAR